jgi:nucleotide-binding universal stress UspA family protein
MEALTVNTVIASVDNSAATRPVLAAAIALAGVLGASVEAIQVVDREPAGRTAQASADSYNVPLSTVAGEPLEALVRLATEDTVAACVLGVRSRPGGRRPAGHIALALADAIDKPVAVVPPECTPSLVLHRVVIAMEGEQGKARRLRRALDLASGAGLELTVVHVDDEGSMPLFSDQVQYETESYARQFLARYCHGAPEARLELRVGRPADQILAVVNDVQPDMLAIGWPQRREQGRGLVALEILRRAGVPVLLVATE